MPIEGERFAFMTGAMLALPERKRLALLLFKLKGLLHEEIGKHLGVSRHSAPRYLTRALAKVAAARAAFERAEAPRASNARQSAQCAPERQGSPPRVLKHRFHRGSERFSSLGHRLGAPFRQQRQR